MTARSQDRVDCFLASQGIPDAILILEEEVPVHSEIKVPGPEVEVSGRMQALAISAPPRLLAISIAPEVGNQCRETRMRETTAATRADGIHLETRVAGRCPPQHAAGEMRRAVGGIPSAG
ncbi:MAG: hypothetical protein JWN92_1961 [Candidatus Acidoferrum typicum]|nr:hypothetical protein [Candidatus Acidoferrum typicum]